MTDITDEFDIVARPAYGFVIYERHPGQQNGLTEPFMNRGAIDYVEYFDISRNGQPINAHPLNGEECERLSHALNFSQQNRISYLKPACVMDTSVLQIDSGKHGFAMWHTPARSQKLLHTESMGIASGEAAVPALLWKATTRQLILFALDSDERPTGDTRLFSAPFANIGAEGNVCMGSVPVRFEESGSLETFIARWETFFFNSYFSHLNNKQPVKSNFVQFWNRLINSGETFPTGELMPTKKTVASL